ncbi:decarboxylating NADP(+)-dependent phosphogluconate dehydrogenase [Flavihumibacter sp. R14]|nr:decarboxylating NADP(+)-dependent phosphogluconate dehydrogenase [Flavihumibacter soli]
MILIVMGVAGSGKTTIGKALAQELGLPFYDADNFHPQSNIDKMRQGTALTDDDRHPWLTDLAAWISRWEGEKGAVLACSALKEQYRKILQSVENITWVYLEGNSEMILQRLESRSGHFMPAALLESQFAALEEPDYGIRVNVSSSPAEIVAKILSKVKMMNAFEFGLIGLGVMGKSLALNLAGKGISISVYNRHVEGREEGIAAGLIADNPKLPNLRGFDNLGDFIHSLARPRKVMMMIYSGAIDKQLEELIPILEAGDVVIDGGNSFYKDTIRRADLLAEKDILYLGTGISGGEEGARKGPSIMAGGSERAYLLMAHYFDLIAAKDQAGEPCSAYIGPGGAGHFVKMVHNGIEYAEMQLLSEIYYLLRHFLKIPPSEIAGIFSEWHTGELNSYLLEITIDILRKEEDGELLLDKILDQAEQKGTGGLSALAALEYGVPYGPLAEAVMARTLSAMRSRRLTAAKLYSREAEATATDREALLSKVKNAYSAARLINHQIGFSLMSEASLRNQWELDPARIAAIWTNGCIIRSVLMEDLALLLTEDDAILTSPVWVPKMRGWQQDFADIVALGLQQGFALPVLSSALNYFLGYTSADSPANLIQAQRDYFGAHTYRRRDKPEDQNFHTNWINI